MGEELRIPCYKGLNSVRQTYRGFVRQIRGVLRVAMSQIPLTDGKRLPLRPPSQYQYQAMSLSGVSFEGRGTRLRTKLGEWVNR